MIVPTATTVMLTTNVEYVALKRLLSSCRTLYDLRLFSGAILCIFLRGHAQFLGIGQNILDSKVKTVTVTEGFVDRFGHGVYTQST